LTHFFQRPVGTNKELAASPAGQEWDALFLLYLPYVDGTDLFSAEFSFQIFFGHPRISWLPQQSS
jgi:hypothetical protein